MKIAQFYDKEYVRLGIINDTGLIPCDFKGEMIDFIKTKSTCKPSGKALALDSITLAPPVSNPSKIVAMGLNYKDHIRESKGEVPKSPLIFAKFPNSLIGHKDVITWDVNLAKKVDFEAELAVIIGEKVHECSETQAMEAIFGYTCANDVSARDLQFGDGQWVRGKSLDTFCPLGPWITTADDIPDPHSLGIRCWLNGQIMQDSTTGMMIFKLPEIISFLSHNFTLSPGDIILTGTPHGVGTFREPSIYMKDGDEVVVEIDKIGRLVNVCHTL
jgi:2-keto-4-pentenoate hydratase/2-oxohepta-3-ene-1,7-dioic acid hydratase in catechol pathway